MILPDINLLVYAYNSDAPGHRKAKVWWETCLSESGPVGLQILQPGPRHLALLESLLQDAQASSNLTTDAHLAALAIEHQAELHSNDGGFLRFPGLRWTNPLQ